MLVLLFELGGDRYALDAREVLEVLPLVELRRLPQAPIAVAGVFDFRGAPVPVIDLTQLTLGRPAPLRFSTRIIVVGDSAGVDRRLFGFIAERATETARRPASDFVSSGITTGQTSHLGPIATDARGLLQLINVKQLLSVHIREGLRQPSMDTSWPSPTSNAS